MLNSDEGKNSSEVDNHFVGPTMTIVIREPAPGDIGWIIGQHGLIYHDHFSFNAEFEEDIAEKVVQFLRSGDSFSRFLMAASGTETVGSLAVSRKTPETAFLNFLLVDPRYRGRGIATALLDNVVEYSRSRGCSLLELETYSCLRDARNLYTNYGFTCFQSSDEMVLYGQCFFQEFWRLTLQDFPLHNKR